MIISKETLVIRLNNHSLIRNRRKHPYSDRRLHQMSHYFFFRFHQMSHYFFFRFRATSAASSQARGQIGAAAASLNHSHSNTGSEPHPRLTPQLVATLGP